MSAAEQSTQWRDTFRSKPLQWIGLLYLLSSLVAGPSIDPGQMSESAHWRIGPLVLGRPVAISGDSPHYLVVVNSLIEDADFDVANNYAQARAGDWDMGTRFRGRDMDTFRHAELDSKGRQLSIHSPFFPLFMAPFAYPFRGTEWVESICIWLTVFFSLLGLYLFSQMTASRHWLLVLALATPFWCYARTLWTESWLMTLWLGMLWAPGRFLLVLFALTGVLIKYTFLVVVVLMAAALWREGRFKDSIVLGCAGGIAVLGGFLFAQYLFSDVDHFSWFHLASHTPQHGVDDAGWFSQISDSFGGVLGLLFDPQDGLLIFSPFLVFAFISIWKKRTWWLPVVGFYLFHAIYAGWEAGTGFSARYLVPMVPVLVLAMASQDRRSHLLTILITYSGIWAILGGFLPALVYDRTPWEIVAHLLEKATASN